MEVVVVVVEGDVERVLLRQDFERVFRRWKLMAFLERLIVEGEKLA